VITGCILILLVFDLCNGADPLPPTTWPMTWSSWVVISVVDSSKQQPIVYNTGQLLAYDPSNHYSCRYNQQDLIFPSVNRSVDMCDYFAGTHYSLYASPDIVNCSTSERINGTLQGIVWPPSFLSAAKFMGIDNVNQANCNHFVAVGISLDGKTQQLDVWTTVDNGYPCQISAWEMEGTLHYNWAFNGFSEFIPPEAMQCTAPEIFCTEPNWICSIKPGISDDSLGEELQRVCNQIDCTPINPYGPYYKPNTVQNHCNWAFNTYFQANRVTQGIESCDFNGTAQLVPPSSNIYGEYSRRNVLQSGSLISNINIIC